MFKRIIQSFVRRRSEIVTSRIEKYLSKSGKILDIGSGSGDVTFVIKSRGYNVTPVDVADFHGPRLVEPVIYDGKKLPFKDKTFDTALLLMVLHHTPNPELILLEAIRVAKELVIIETSYESSISKIHTVIADAIGNLRLEAFWNSYKTDDKWRELFRKLGLKFADSQKYKDRIFGLPFLHILYYVN